MPKIKTRSIRIPACIATFDKEDAKELVRLLQKAGYKTWIRGRGQRNINGPGRSREYQDYLPLDKAKKFAVYITGVRQWKKEEMFHNAMAWEDQDARYAEAREPVRVWGLRHVPPLGA